MTDENHALVTLMMEESSWNALPNIKDNTLISKEKSNNNNQLTTTRTIHTFVFNFSIIILFFNYSCTNTIIGWPSPQCRLYFSKSNQDVKSKSMLAL